MADGCYGILFSTMLRRKSPLGRFQRQGESYYARPFGRAFSSVPQDVARQKWLFGVGEFRNAAAKRSSITIRGSDSQRASLARATKIPGISAPWRRYCISDGFFPSLPTALTRVSSPPFVLSLALRSTSLFPLITRTYARGRCLLNFHDVYVPPKWLNLGYDPEVRCCCLRYTYFRQGWSIPWMHSPFHLDECMLTITWLHNPRQGCFFLWCNSPKYRAECSFRV